MLKKILNFYYTRYFLITFVHNNKPIAIAKFKVNLSKFTVEEYLSMCFYLENLNILSISQVDRLVYNNFSIETLSPINTKPV